jgi:5'-nucleotidase/UDP-sugar diphosphatase
MRIQAWSLAVASVVSAACGPPALREQQTPRLVTLLYTADIHSHLLGEKLSIGAADAAHGLGAEGDTATVGGAARLATVLTQARSKGTPALYLDAGDLLEGTSFFPTFGGVPEMRVADALCLDAMAAGNHDLAFGASSLAALRKEWGQFFLLAANLDEEEKEGLVLPYALIDRGGVRVAVIGLGRRPDRAPSLAGCAAAIGEIVSHVRAESDLVVLLSHLGRDADLALVPLTTGVDVVIGGHTHDVIDPPALVLDCDSETANVRGCQPRPVPVVHPGAYGRYLGRADLVLSSDPADAEEDSGGRPSVVVDARFSILPVTESTPERADLRALIAPYADSLERAGLGRPIGFAPAPLSRRGVARGDSALGNLVADAMRDAASADLAVMNTTGIRADLVAGIVTLDDLVRVLPFADDLVTLRLSGQELLDAVRGAAVEACRASAPSPFQISGAKVIVDCHTGTLGLEVSGRAVDPASSYRIAAPSFLTGAGRWLVVPGAEPAAPVGGTVLDAVVNVLGEGEPCPESTENRLPCLVARADGRIVWR